MCIFIKDYAQIFQNVSFYEFLYFFLRVTQIFQMHFYSFLGWLNSVFMIRPNSIKLWKMLRINLNKSQLHNVEKSSTCRTKNENSPPVNNFSPFPFFFLSVRKTFFLSLNWFFISDLPIIQMGFLTKRSLPQKPIYFDRQPADHSRMTYSTPKKTTRQISIQKSVSLANSW